MSIVDISHKWQKGEIYHSCYFFPDSEDIGEPLYCTCGHVWVTFSEGEGGTVMKVGADAGYDPVTTWCEDEEIITQPAPDDGYPYVRLEEGTGK